MDGDSSRRALDKGATAAKPHVDMADDSMFDPAKAKGEPIGEKTTGAGTPAFNKDGAIGKQFTTSGVLGGAAQKIGGPLDKDGMIGKHFTTGGSIGGSVQEHLGKGESASVTK
ncbi:hypothetical protein BDZ85DRAFT_250467 [Elsinoe ampelina]|uniref:Uncharacterized protein n=1 Tax=Elsinoe ampelina TaxID=302913 RepID=A0A6A6GAJ7_9PEZI|nr:hypothetical protein BDZ85DRAFT_250467 [Elsinoe ampelina]